MFKEVYARPAPLHLCGQGNPGETLNLTQTPHVSLVPPVSRHRLWTRALDAQPDRPNRPASRLARSARRSGSFGFFGLSGSLGP